MNDEQKVLEIQRLMDLGRKFEALQFVARRLGQEVAPVKPLVELFAWASEASLDSFAVGNPPAVIEVLLKTTATIAAQGLVTVMSALSDEPSDN